VKIYQENIKEVLKSFETNAETGLTGKQIQQCTKKYGQNVLPTKPEESWFWVFISQFQNPLIYILLAAAAIIFFMGEDRLDAFIISGVLFFNAIIGTIQEGRTRSILHSLQQFIKADSVVIRDGQKRLIEDKYIVPGDIIVLQEGARVPADARIIESNNMQIDEAVLTGESRPVRKVVELKPDERKNENLPVADQKNMLFKGTYVLSGSGLAVVVATGKHSEIGKIHTEVEEIQMDMPLKQELDRLSYWILIAILVMCVGMFVIGFLTGKPISQLLVMLTALFICVVPEGLPVVLTLVLVSGVYRMAKKQVLVKKMHAVEGLGRTDVIIVDKTGTLTRNEMMVSRVYVDGQRWRVSGQGYDPEGELFITDTKVTDLEPYEELRRFAHACYLLGNAEITYLPQRGAFDIKGDPTEAALKVFGQKLGFDGKQLKKEYRKLFEIPFDPELRYHAMFFDDEDKGRIFIAGSPETILSRCAHISDGVREELEHMLRDGLRVVAVAQKTFDIQVLSKDKPLDFEEACKLVENHFEFLGLCGIQDAIRPEVAAMVSQARDAGLEVIMATGDHKKTALYVAKQVGIIQEGDEIIDGSEIDDLSDEQLLARLPRVKVYSRVSPIHKLRIVKLFHDRNKIVAMTGDGINDAPSLVAADLGIAMGGIGTEVAKQASDLILLDDSFANIVRAIQEGRHIFYTLKRVVLYFFATNMGEILVVLFALLLNMPLPITAAQILWLNLVTDGFLDVALSTEPQEEGLLHKKWLHRKIHLVDPALMSKMMFMALPMGIVSLAVFHHYQANIAYARTMALLTMAMFQWFNAWNCRSDTKSVFQLGLFSNRWLLLATGFVFGLQLLLVYAPFMQRIFKTVPITFEQWCMVIALSSSIFILEEMRKWVMRTCFPDYN